MMKTLPFWLWRFASVRHGDGGKNCENVTPIVGKMVVEMGEGVM